MRTPDRHSECLQPATPGNGRLRPADAQLIGPRLSNGRVAPARAAWLSVPATRRPAPHSRPLDARKGRPRAPRAARPSPHQRWLTPGGVDAFGCCLGYPHVSHNSFSRQAEIVDNCVPSEPCRTPRY